MGSPRIIVVMGVSGAGKTTVGRLLAEALAWPFHDADDYHPADNIEQMRRSIPLTDRGREPWLRALRDLLGAVLARGEHALLAASALRQAYRDALIPPGAKAGEIRFAYLHTSPETLRRRLETRQGHFASVALLESQLATLEAPTDAFWADGEATPRQIVEEIRRQFGL